MTSSKHQEKNWEKLREKTKNSMREKIAFGILEDFDEYRVQKLASF